MKRITTALEIGAEAHFLHAGDTHLTFADGRDDERKNLLAAKRAKVFPTAESDFEEIIATSRKEKLPICHTGDLIDFVSEKNLDAARRFASECDMLFSAGNHEFSLYVGEAWEDEAYRNKSLAKVNAAFACDVRFSSRVIGGVNCVAIDNSYYLFDAEQLEKLKRETEKGLPTVLFMHTPLYERKLYDVMMERAECAYLCGVPEELMKFYSENRYRQQLADDITLETIDFIKNCQNVKAIFAGHNHFDYEGYVTETLPQFITGIGTIREVILK